MLEIQDIDKESVPSSICNEVNKFVREVEGNYMVFFPSYEYMYKAYDFLKECISLDRFDDSIWRHGRRGKRKVFK